METLILQGGIFLRISVFGDLCPTDLNVDKFIEGDSGYLFGEITELISSSDISIVNLECPLTECENEHYKSGPNLKAPSSSISAIKKAGFSVVSLANNHIKDYGNQGVFDTIEVCKKTSLLTVGAGDSSFSAKTPLFINIEGKRIGILSLADNECSCANENSAGANGFDFCDSFDDIHVAKMNCDYLVILYHSGLEHYQYPSPSLKKRCRKMAEKGANIIVCQHSHCIGTYELYKDTTILYGQGNFLFANKNKGELWNTGVIMNIEVTGDTYSCEFIPTKMVDGRVRFCKETEKDNVLRMLRERSEFIEYGDNINLTWEKFCKDRESMYFAILLGFPRFLYRINKVLNNIIGKLIITKHNAVVIENIIRCESHNESLMKVIANRYKK